MLDNIMVLAAAPVFHIQLILNGVFVGAIFALAAYGLALVWGVMNVKNLAQGEFVILGGYLAYTFDSLGLHPILAIVPVIAVMFAFGWAVYFLVIRWIIRHDMFTSLLATFGMALVIQQAINLVFGSSIETVDSGFEVRSIIGGMVTVADIKLTSFLMCVLLAVVVVVFMKRSRMGQAIRATAQDPRAARVMGIDTEKVYAFTFALNSAICGAAGVMISMIWVIQPFYGITYSIRSFVIVTAAGFGNLPGVIAAALGLGVAEQYSGFILGAEFQQATVVGLLVLVLVWRQLILSRHRQVVQ